VSSTRGWRVLGVEGVWWSPRSSKPLRPDRVGLGGFDSHTLPPARLRPIAVLVARAALLCFALMGSASALVAQEAGGRRLGPERPDSGAVPADVAPMGPPITPRRAFLTSLILPGAGQARLDRPVAGGVFLLIEAAALALRHRSAEDLRLARSFSRDSTPLTYQVDPVTGIVARDGDGNPIVVTWARSRYSEAWVRTRRLHVEDWTAVLIFNHLFAGADAFVAAQLWDIPEKVGVRATPLGPALVATFRFGRAPKR
jgi:hypothetical protein